MSAVLAQNLELLEQGADLLRRIDDAVYQATSEQQASHRVGPHLRHCVDAYRSLLAGLDDGLIDYDTRRRGRRIETDRDAGMAALDGLSRELGALDALDSELELAVRIDTPPGVDPAEATGRSTLQRELQFLVGHTMHHYALIALILRQRGFDPGRDFGVAPSTLRHWDGEEAERA